MGLNTDDYSYSDTQVKYIDYAWAISCNEEFLYTLKGENGAISHDRKHPKQPGSVGTDWGFCGTNDYWQKAKINDKRFFTDWKWQNGS